MHSQKLVGDEAAKIGQGKAFRNKWIAKDGAGFVRAVSAVLLHLSGGKLSLSNRSRRR